MLNVTARPGALLSVLPGTWVVSSTRATIAYLLSVEGTSSMSESPRFANPATWATFWDNTALIEPSIAMVGPQIGKFRL